MPFPCIYLSPACMIDVRKDLRQTETTINIIYWFFRFSLVVHLGKTVGPFLSSNPQVKHEWNNRLYSLTRSGIPHRVHFPPTCAFVRTQGRRLPSQRACVWRKYEKQVKRFCTSASVTRPIPLSARWGLRTKFSNTARKRPARNTECSAATPESQRDIG